MCKSSKQINFFLIQHIPIMSIENINCSWIGSNNNLKDTMRISVKHSVKPLLTFVNLQVLQTSPLGRGAWTVNPWNRSVRSIGFVLPLEQLTDEIDQSDRFSLLFYLVLKFSNRLAWTHTLYSILLLILSLINFPHIVRVYCWIFNRESKWNLYLCAVEYNCM